MVHKAAYVFQISNKVKLFLLNCNNQLYQTNSYW